MAVTALCLVAIGYRWLPSDQKRLARSPTFYLLLGLRILGYALIWFEE